MGVALESAIEQDRSMALVLTEETKTDRLERIVSDLITELGLDITDQHFEGTPARVARLYRELTRGSRLDPVKILSASSPHLPRKDALRLRAGRQDRGPFQDSPPDSGDGVSTYRARRSGFRDSGHFHVGREAFGLRGACYGSARLRCRPRSEMP